MSSRWRARFSSSAPRRGRDLGEGDPAWLHAPEDTRGGGRLPASADAPTTGGANRGAGRPRTEPGAPGSCTTVVTRSSVDARLPAPATEWPDRPNACGRRPAGHVRGQAGERGWWRRMHDPIHVAIAGPRAARDDGDHLCGLWHGRDALADASRRARPRPSSRARSRRTTAPSTLRPARPPAVRPKRRRGSQRVHRQLQEDHRDRSPDRRVPAVRPGRRPSCRRSRSARSASRTPTTSRPTRADKSYPRRAERHRAVQAQGVGQGQPDRPRRPTPTTGATAALTPNLEFRWSDQAAQRLLELQSGTVDGIDNPGADDIAGDQGRLRPRRSTRARA